MTKNNHTNPYNTYRNGNKNQSREPSLALLVVASMSLLLPACSKDKDNPTPEPQTLTNAIILDGVTKPVLRAQLDEFETHHELYLFLEEEKAGDVDYIPEQIVIAFNITKHNEQTIDLTKIEEGILGSVWAIDYRSSKDSFCLSEHKDYPQCTSGTMKVAANLSTNETSIEISGAKGKDTKQTDPKEHTFSLRWKGKAPLTKYV